MIKDKTNPGMLREELLYRASTTMDLPMLNSMMNGIFKVIADPDSSFDQLLSVVKYDQAISAKIISIANSVYYYHQREASITGLERAMAVVGFREMKRIIMSLVFMKQIMAPWNIGQDDMAAIWEHSLTVALAARTLSERMAVEDPEKAFAISILHDIGKVIFYTCGDDYRRIAEEALLGGRDVCDLERAAYGIDHQEVGHSLSVRWEFPKEFSEVILSHHEPHDGKVSIIDIVRDADAFACGRENGFPEKERTLLEHEKELIEVETERIKLLMVV
jgi:putative nucleotidyltransferase with HDIG domain